MTDPVRIALIGCGRIAQVAHLPAIEKADGVELVAVCDGNRPVAEAVARRYGVPAVYTDAVEVFRADDVEAVIIAVPDRFHLGLASAALEGGKHVLIEKPLAATVEQCIDLVDQVRQRGLKLQVGAMKRHDAGIEYARDVVQTTLGELRSFHAWYRIGDLRPGIEHTLFPRVYSDASTTTTESTFKADRQRYLLATHGSHIFDTVRYLAGEIVAIDARHGGFGRDHMWSALVRTASGAVGTVSLTVDVPGLPSEGVELFGSRGTVRVDTPFPFYRLASTVHAYADGQTRTPVLTDGDPYERQLEAFARAIREDLEPAPNAQDGLAAVRAIEATAASVEAGHEVTL